MSLFLKLVLDRLRKALDLRVDNSRIIDSKVTGDFSVDSGTTLKFRGDGILEDVKLIGSDIEIVSEKSGPIFKNCDFSNTTFKNSTLTMENFGMVGDMTSETYNYTFKGKEIQTKKRTGTDNNIKIIGDALSNSENVKFIISEKYYSSVNRGMITIKNATNLEILGNGALTTGLRFEDCKDIKVRDLKFYGFHELHDFPPVYAYASNLPKTINGVEYTTSNSFNLTADGYENSGISFPAITLYASNPDDCSEHNCHFNIDNIYAEMRQSGVDAGTYISAKTGISCVSDVNITNCTFDHIYFQPIGLHTVGANINNVTGNYCLQGLDISTGSSNVIVDNINITNSAIGPKQEAAKGYYDKSFNNKIINSSFEINESYIILDASQFICSIAEGRDKDEMVIESTVFNINKDRESPGFMTRSYSTLLKDVDINISVNDKNSNHSYDIMDLFSVYGSTSHSPVLNMDDVRIRLNDKTRIYYVATPHGSYEFSIVGNNVNIAGDGTITVCFQGMKSVSFTNSSSEIKDWYKKDINDY